MADLSNPLCIMLPSLVFLVLSGTTTMAQPVDSEKQLIPNEARQAWTGMEETISKLSFVSNHTVSFDLNNKEGQPAVVLPKDQRTINRILQLNGMLLLQQTHVDDRPLRDILFCCNGRYGFIITRQKEADSPWVINTLQTEELDDFKRTITGQLAFAIKAPYSISERSIIEVLSDPKYTFEALKRLDRPNVAQLTFEIPSVGTTGRIILDPVNRWSVTDYRFDHAGKASYYMCHIDYLSEEISGFRPVSRAVITMVGPGGKRVDDFRFDRPDAAPPDPSAFLLSSYGLPEPARPAEARSNAGILLIGLGFAVGLLGWATKRYVRSRGAIGGS